MFSFTHTKNIPLCTVSLFYEYGKNKEKRRSSVYSITYFILINCRLVTYKRVKTLISLEVSTNKNFI